MRAMIFAAGLGTRLNELTRDIPKALVLFKGRPLLEHLILRLISFDIRDIIINVHHFPEKIISFVKSKNSFGINISFSVEDRLLDTGGGLKKAQDFFRGDEPFLVHNVDVMTSLNYFELLHEFKKGRTYAALAVRKRETSRYLLFDDGMVLRGWESIKENKKIIPFKNSGSLTRYSFMGIQIMSPMIFNHFPEKEKFSIIDVYLNIIAKGGVITGLDAGETFWFDLGTNDRIKEALLFFDKKQT